jgi:hypothetical protein
MPDDPDALHEKINLQIINLRDEIAHNEETGDLKLGTIRLELDHLRQNHDDARIAVKEAKEIADRHFEESNNFRDQLGKQSQHFVTAEQVEKLIAFALANERLLSSANRSTDLGIAEAKAKTISDLKWAVYVVGSGLLGLFFLHISNML